MADVKHAPKTKVYILKPGMKHSGRDPETNDVVDYHGDDEDRNEVHLTDTAYEAFKDKFEVPESEKRKSKRDGAAPGEELKTPTSPQHPIDTKSQATKAPAAGETKPGDDAKGAGAAQNSSNTAKT